MNKIIIKTLLICLVATGIFAQEPLNDEGNNYKDTDGKVYVNRNISHKRLDQGGRSEK